MNAVTTNVPDAIEIEWCGGEGYTLFSATTFNQCIPYVAVERTPEDALESLMRRLDFNRIPLTACKRSLEMAA